MRSILAATAAVKRSRGLRLTRASWSMACRISYNAACSQRLSKTHNRHTWINVVYPSLVSHSGYSQSKSNPSKPLRLTKLMAESMNVRLFCAMDTSRRIRIAFSCENLYPPNESKVLRSGCFNFSALTRLYMPMVPHSAPSSFHSNGLGQTNVLQNGQRVVKTEPYLRVKLSCITTKA